MRFLLPAIALLFLGFIGFSSADLRFASTPDTRFAVRNRDGSVAFSTTLALYMEPNTFGYQGLRNQKQNNYDNFLRSNIDNEQDNRNFNQEAGKDHLPFRTFEAKATDETNQLTPSVQLTVEPGKEYVLPLRWNNPHASEMELNIWIMDNTIVVPIKRPVCSGEGYQDGVISFIVPKDFNDLGSKVAGFTGCNSPGDCVLQMYAHSVEPRTYAAGTPIIVVGFDPSKPKAADNSAVKPKTQDPGTDLSKQPNEVCLPSTDASSNIASAVPQWARHVSDVFNHAYQNSDYSPYSGQQHEYISKTMQAACVLRMVNGNRGELGASILTQEQKNTLQNLRNAADNLVNNYEQLTNQIINQVLKNNAKTSGKAGVQQLNNCFRCLETASVSNNRQETNTYVPSFKITNQNQLAQARQIAQNRDNGKYAKLINANGVVQIYIQALTDMAPAYQQLQAKYGLGYQPAREKVAASTMPDISAFKKINANGGNDGGKYAATQAKAALAAEKTAVALPSGEIIIQSARWTDRALNAAGQHSAFTGTATADQKFVWKSTGQIQIAGTNKCLDVSGVLVTVDGTKIIPWDCDATGMKANQVFYRRGAKMIQIPSTTKCIDTTNVNDVGTSFHIWECADTNQNQQFNILDAVTGAAVPATKSSSFDDTSMVFNGLDIEGSSFFGANFDISTLDANAIGLLNIGGGLAPNADDDPKKQNGYDDREDAINGLSIKQTDAALADSSSSSSSSSSSGMSSAMSLGIGAAGGALLTALIAGGIIFKMKKQNQAQNTNNRVFADARV